jgi:hypothetical protein
MRREEQRLLKGSMGDSRSRPLLLFIDQFVVLCVLVLVLYLYTYIDSCYRSPIFTFQFDAQAIHPSIH